MQRPVVPHRYEKDHKDRLLANLGRKPTCPDCLALREFEREIANTHATSGATRAGQSSLESWPG